MNHHFISYENALKLKELGFEEPCFGHYLKKKFYLKFFDRQSDGITLAPLYQQAIPFILKQFIDKDEYPQGGYGIRYFCGGSGRIFEVGCSELYVKFANQDECLTKLIELYENPFYRQEDK
jgi:hypothetical protein